jgi:hypothetical protein
MGSKSVLAHPDSPPLQRLVPPPGDWKHLQAGIDDDVQLVSGVLNGGVPPEASGNSRETPVTPKIGGMAFGYYPTISDIVRIARLYQAFGAHQGQKLLYAPKIKEIFARTSMPGLPTGEATPYGEVFYFNTFWKAPYSTP